MGLLVPVVVIAAPTWEWVVFANALLGVNRGLCWSMTVIMKIDLVGPARRGLALGVNEFAGYLAMGVAALAGAQIAAASSLRTGPFVLAAVVAAVGGLASILGADRGNAGLKHAEPVTARLFQDEQWVAPARNGIGSVESAGELRGHR